MVFYSWRCFKWYVLRSLFDVNGWTDFIALGKSLCWSLQAGNMFRNRFKILVTFFLNDSFLPKTLGYGSKIFANLQTIKRPCHRSDENLRHQNIWLRCVYRNAARHFYVRSLLRFCFSFFQVLTRVIFIFHFSFVRRFNQTSWNRRELRCVLTIVLNLFNEVWEHCKLAQERRTV
jgi:hypothetical protein